MPFRLSEAASKTAEKATRGPASVLGNPVAASLIVSLIALIIIVECLKLESYPKIGWRTKCRMLFYVFLVTSVLLALHYYMIDRNMQDKYKTSSYSSTVDQIIGGSRENYASPQSVEIRPGSVYSKHIDGGKSPQQPSAYAFAQRGAQHNPFVPRAGQQYAAPQPVAQTAYPQRYREESVGLSPVDLDF